MRLVIGRQCPPAALVSAQQQRTSRDAAGVLTQFGAVDAIHVVEHEVTNSQDPPFGTRYTVEGELTTPQGRRPLVRVVWFVDEAASVPRFVTAYPLGGSTQ